MTLWARLKMIMHPDQDAPAALQNAEAKLDDALDRQTRLLASIIKANNEAVLAAHEARRRREG